MIMVRIQRTCADAKVMAIDWLRFIDVERTDLAKTS